MPPVGHDPRNRARSRSAARTPAGGSGRIPRSPRRDSVRRTRILLHSERACRRTVRLRLRHALPGGRDDPARDAGERRAALGWGRRWRGAAVRAAVHSHDHLDESSWIGNYRRRAARPYPRPVRLACRQRARRGGPRAAGLRGRTLHFRTVERRPPAPTHGHRGFRRHLGRGELRRPAFVAGLCRAASGGLGGGPPGCSGRIPYDPYAGSHRGASRSEPIAAVLGVGDPRRRNHRGIWLRESGICATPNGARGWLRGACQVPSAASVPDRDESRREPDGTESPPEWKLGDHPVALGVSCESIAGQLPDRGSGCPAGRFDIRRCALPVPRLERRWQPFAPCVSACIRKFPDTEPRARVPAPRPRGGSGLDPGIARERGWLLRSRHPSYGRGDFNSD